LIPSPSSKRQRNILIFYQFFKKPHLHKWDKNALLLCIIMCLQIEVFLLFEIKKLLFLTRWGTRCCRLRSTNFIQISLEMLEKFQNFRCSDDQLVIFVQLWCHNFLINYIQGDQMFLLKNCPKTMKNRPKSRPTMFLLDLLYKTVLWCFLFDFMLISNGTGHSFIVFLYIKEEINFFEYFWDL